jgi:hypothetical protein
MILPVSITNTPLLIPPCIPFYKTEILRLEQ